MLRIDHQDGRFRSDEPGAGPGVSGRQRRGAIRGPVPAEIYAWTERTLTRHEYGGLSRREKGVLRLLCGPHDGAQRAQ